MALVTRTIAGALKDANGTALAGISIIFTPGTFFGSTGILIVPRTETIVTNGSGDYTVDLGVDDTPGTYVEYHCSIGSARFNFNLVAGSAISLDELI